MDFQHDLACLEEFLDDLKKTRDMFLRKFVFHFTLVFAG